MSDTHEKMMKIIHKVSYCHVNIYAHIICTHVCMYTYIISMYVNTEKKWPKYSKTANSSCFCLEVRNETSVHSTCFEPLAVSTLSLLF